MTTAEISLLRQLLDAGDRGAFHFIYGEMADNEDSRLTAKISTFSDSVGGTAFAANWKLQREHDEYAGIYKISQQIAEDKLDLAMQEADDPAGTGFLSVDEHFNAATSTWNSN